MHNAIKKYLKEINEYKNKMLENYKNLVVAYEDSREVYGQIIDEYVNLSSTIIPCSQIVGYTNTLNAPQWILTTLDEVILYKSKEYIEFDTWILDLSTILDLSETTLLRLKAYDDGQRKTFTSDIILQYLPNSNTVYFHTGPTNSASIQKIDYNALVESSSKPPVLKCSSIYAYNDAHMITKWALRKDSQDLFLSDRCRHEHSITINLHNLNMSPGTQFILKSNIIGGSDSVAYMILEYDPLSTTRANFKLYGNLIDSLTSYQGTSTIL